MRRGGSRMSVLLGGQHGDTSGGVRGGTRAGEADERLERAAEGGLLPVNAMAL